MVTIQLSCRDTYLLCRTMVSTCGVSLPRLEVGKEGVLLHTCTFVCRSWRCRQSEKHLGRNPVEGSRMRTSRAFVTSHTKSSAHSMLASPGLASLASACQKLH